MLWRLLGGAKSALFSIPEFRRFRAQMIPKVIAYYTDNAYRAHAERLSKSLQKFGVTHETKAYPANLTWREAVLEKPGFIKSQLGEAGRKGCEGIEGIIYTDADSELKRLPPVGSLVDVDFACVKWRRNVHHEEEYLSGTMYFARNDAVRAFVDEWSVLTQKYRYHDTPEQMGLREYFQSPSELRTAWLPIEWCYVRDQMEACADPIFEHYQASRVNRHE